MKERVVFLVAVLGMAPLLWSQDLADAARKEKERRSKVQAAGGTLTNDDLKTTKGQLANDPSQAPLAPADPATKGRSAASPATPPSIRPSQPAGATSQTGPAPTSMLSNAPANEAAWRSRGRWLRGEVRRLEKEVGDLDGKATGSAYGVATSKSFPGETREQKRDREGDNKVAQAGWQADRAATLQGLEQAKANLERARKVLADFEEGARRAGVPMAWLSE